MSRARVLRRQEKAYIELPPDISGEAELEIFQLREGFYLVSIPLGQPGERPASSREGGAAGDRGISNEERAVMKKLLAIRFENRTPAFVEKSLDETERATLQELAAKGLVSVFRGNKYRDGVYSISDSAYALVYPKGEARAGGGQDAAGASGGGSPSRQYRTAPQEPPAGASGAQAALGSRGFAIIQDRREAMMLSEQYQAQMKAGSVIGVKGFDGKFYIVTRDFFTRTQAAVGAALKEPMDAASIAAAVKADPEGCLAVLRLMAENGDIIEKKKGIFAPV
jgi:hypothetical protein